MQTGTGVGAVSLTPTAAPPPSTGAVYAYASILHNVEREKHQARARVAVEHAVLVEHSHRADDTYGMAARKTHGLTQALSVRAGLQSRHESRPSARCAVALATVNIAHLLTLLKTPIVLAEHVRHHVRCCPGDRGAELRRQVPVCTLGEPQLAGCDFRVWHDLPLCTGTSGCCRAAEYPSRRVEARVKLLA